MTWLNLWFTEISLEGRGRRGGECSWRYQQVGFARAQIKQWMQEKDSRDG
jgi:hypothetical protein